jgi:diguanylate cyclase (GGDEF)-like protein
VKINLAHLAGAASMSVPQPRDLSVIDALHGRSMTLVAWFDPRDILIYANVAFRRAYGLDADERMSWSDLMRRCHALQIGARIETDDFEAWLLSAKSRRGKTPCRSFEADLQDGRWVLMTEETLGDGSMLCQAVDVTRLRADERQLRVDRDLAQRAALTDPLTGLGNRRHVFERLEAALAHARARGEPLSVALFDLDRFKTINDRFGHQIGDATLRDFACRAGAAVRRGDLFGRLGGEEFLLVQPGADLDGATAAAAWILARARAKREARDGAPAYTVSAGVASLRAQDDAQSLYARADAALYRAKQGGRDRVATEDALAQETQAAPPRGAFGMGG